MTMTTITSILSNPDVINFTIGIITFIAGIITSFIANKKKLKDSKDFNQFNLLVEIAKEESIKLVNLNMSNESKKRVVIKNITDRLPENIKKNIDEETVEQALTLAYQYFIKPNIKKEDK